MSDNHTPEGLPPLPKPTAWMMKWAQHSPSFTIDKSDYVSWFAGKASYPEDLHDLFTADQVREIQLKAFEVGYEALRAQAAGVVLVAEVTKYYDHQHHNVISKYLPVGTKLYASAPPAHVPADVVVEYEVEQFGGGWKKVTKSQYDESIDRPRRVVHYHPNEPAQAVFQASAMGPAVYDTPSGEADQLLAAMNWPKLNAVAEEYLAEYEFRGDGGDYSPNERESMLIADAVHGFIASDEFVEVLQAAQHPAPSPAQAVDAALLKRIAQTRKWQSNSVIGPRLGPDGLSVEDFDAIGAALAARQPQAQQGGGDYTELFNAIGAAVEWKPNKTFEISVERFKAALATKEQRS